jgi:hypothetical protein
MYPWAYTKMHNPTSVTTMSMTAVSGSISVPKLSQVSPVGIQFHRLCTNGFSGSGAETSICPRTPSDSASEASMPATAT